MSNGATSFDNWSRATACDAHRDELKNKQKKDVSSAYCIKVSPQLPCLEIIFQRADATRLVWRTLLKKRLGWTERWTYFLVTLIGWMRFSTRWTLWGGVAGR